MKNHSVPFEVKLDSPPRCKTSYRGDRGLPIAGQPSRVQVIGQICRVGTPVAKTSLTENIDQVWLDSGFHARVEQA